MSQPSESPPLQRIAIVGGGISGLAAAHRLCELSVASGTHVDVRLFEAQPRLGGVIATERTNDLLLESGPDSFLSEKPWGIGLCQRIGLEDQLIGTREELRRTYIDHAGRLHPLPDGFLMLAPTRFLPLITSQLFSWRGKLRMGLDLVLPRRTAAGDESLSEFVGRRLGREVLDRVAQPLVGGIYTADPARLSVAATMPRFLEMERQYRSIIWAMWRQQRQTQRSAGTSGARWSLFLSFRGGMQTLVNALAQRLPEGVVRTGIPVSAVRPRADGGWDIGSDGRWDAVIVATPAHRAADLLVAAAPQLATELRAIPYASAAIVNLVYRREEIPHPLNGFGFVVPFIEGRKIIACTFSSLKYEGRAPAEHIVVRAFVGGALQPHLLSQDDDTMAASVRTELQQLVGVTALPRLKRVARWNASMPQYHVGHIERRERIAALMRPLRGLALAGNAYRGVGIPDCIHSGETAAEQVFATATGVPIVDGTQRS